MKTELTNKLRRKERKKRQNIYSKLNRGRYIFIKAIFTYFFNL